MSIDSISQKSEKVKKRIEKPHDRVKIEYPSEMF